MEYTSYPQSNQPKHLVQVRILLQEDITFLPTDLGNVISCSKADFGISLVAYEPNVEIPTFYGVLLCKERDLDNDSLKGRGIELITYSSTSHCKPHDFLKLLKKIVANIKDDNGNPIYNYVYAKIMDSVARNRFREWYGFNTLKEDLSFLYMTREKILQEYE